MFENALLIVLGMGVCLLGILTATMIFLAGMITEATKALRMVCREGGARK